MVDSYPEWESPVSVKAEVQPVGKCAWIYKLADGMPIFVSPGASQRFVCAISALLPATTTTTAENEIEIEALVTDHVPYPSFPGALNGEVAGKLNLNQNWSKTGFILPTDASVNTATTFSPVKNSADKLNPTGVSIAPETQTTKVTDQYSSLEPITKASRHVIEPTKLQRQDVSLTSEVTSFMTHITSKGTFPTLGLTNSATGEASSTSKVPHPTPEESSTTLDATPSTPIVIYPRRVMNSSPPDRTTTKQIATSELEGISNELAEPSSKYEGEGISGDISCGPIVSADGKTYSSRCVVHDKAALCTSHIENGKEAAVCACSPGWTGVHCSLKISDLEKLAPFLDNSTDIGSFIEMMTEAKKTPNVFAEQLPSIMQTMNESTRSDLSWAIDDLVQFAAYNDRSLSVHDEFMPFNDASLGNCFTFNHIQKKMHRVKNIGSSYGLFARLRLNASESLPWTDTDSIRIFIHPPGSVVFKETNSFSARPGGEDHIIINTRTRLVRLAGAYGSCTRSKADVPTYYFDGDYDVNGCYRSCYQDVLLRTCKCMDSSYNIPKDRNITSCSFNMKCMKNVVSNRSDVSNWPECHCPPPCQSIQYSFSWSRVTFSRAALSCKSDTDSCLSNFLSRVLIQVGSLGGVLLGFSLIFPIELAFLVSILVRRCYAS